jgi:Ca2+-binding RTX toxin-like protein
MLSSIERAVLTTGAGNNTINAAGFSGSTILDGGDGTDTLTGGSSSDVLIGGGGDDMLAGGGGSDRYQFDVDLVLGNDTVDEGAGGGSDILDFSLTENVGLTISLGLTTQQIVHNTNLRLTLTSDTAVEHIIGGAQIDLLTGNSADNFVLGGAGDDSINGQGGTDTVVEFRDADFTLTNSALTIVMQTGMGPLMEVDSLSNIESAFLLGGEGDNALDASAFSLGDVILSGGQGNDTLKGGMGDDALSGGEGNDLLEGNDGDDTLSGDGGNDGLYAGIGNDTLNGGAGDDTLHGGGYDPTLMGLSDDDLLFGGNGNDTYVFDRSLQLGTDSLTEFDEMFMPEAGYNDVILGLGLSGTDIDLQLTMTQDFLGEIDDMGTIGVVLHLTLTIGGTVEDAF